MEESFGKNSTSSISNPQDVDSESPTKDYLKNKTVLVTGGLGFLGKLLIEKLLTCDVKKIYLLARPKRGKSLTERFESLTSDPVFSNLLKHQENPFSKVYLIKGDLQQIDLGLSIEDSENLINDVEIVFHAAADVRFDESLKEATEINVRGTREIMLLSSKMLNLDVFVYVSTAFCTPGFIVREKFYETNLDPDFMIHLVENFKPDDLEDFEVVARRFIQPHPNTYTYSKALAEQIVRRYGNDFHTAIVRPAIISTTLYDPIPGYTDNVYGVNGVVTGAGVGVLRILHIDNRLKANIIPADFVVNTILAVAWFTVSENNFKRKQKAPYEELRGNENFHHESYDKNIKIYHSTVSNNNPVTWGDVKEKSTAEGIKYPIARSLWIICYNTTSHYYLCQFLKIFYHFLPALLIDSFLKYNNKKPKLLKIYRKVNKFSEVLSFFTNNEWTFDNGNMEKLCEAMSDHDKKFFRCNVDEIIWDDFFRVFCAGLRRFICKETLETLPEAKRRYRWMTILHYLLLASIYLFLGFITYEILKFYGFFRYASLSSRVEKNLHPI